jgi:hypothetical protein
MVILRSDTKAVILALIGLCVMGTAGCVSNSPELSAVEREIEKNNHVDNLLAKEFTTVGKLTKTIETPWGAREIYDPVQDVLVRKAFESFYRKEYETAALYNSSEARRALGDKDVDLVFAAKNIHETDAMRLGCKILKNYNCGGNIFFHTHVNPERWKKCSYLKNLGKIRTECEKIFIQESYGTSQGACSINGKVRPDMARFPVGNNISSSTPEIESLIKPMTKNLNWETQVQDFFSFECTEWR